MEKKRNFDCICEWCGQPFKGTTSRARFCPEHAGHEIAYCAECGKPVLVMSRDRRYNTFCSEECREKSRLRKLRASVSANVARRYPNCDFDADSYQKAEDPIHLRCRTCGHEFTISYHTIKPSREGEASGCPKCNEAEAQKEQEARKQQRSAEAKKRAEQRELEAYMRAENRRLKIIAKQSEVKICEQCGEEFIARNSRHKRFCSDNCATRYANHLKDHRRKKKIRANGNVDPSITLEKLYKRDKGVCQICGITCDWEDKTEINRTFIAGKTYPSIDHKIPLAKGGQHTWENVQLLCRGCNSIKSDTLVLPRSQE